MPPSGYRAGHTRARCTVGRKLWLRAVPYFQVKCSNMKQPRGPSEDRRLRRPLEWDRAYMNMCVSSWAHTSACSHTCREHVEHMCILYIHIDMLSSLIFPHMSIRCFTQTHTHTLLCASRLHLWNHMYGSLFEPVARALVTELIWDLKSEMYD